MREPWGSPPPPPSSANVEMVLACESAEWTATARSFRLQKKPSPHTHHNPFLPPPFPLSNSPHRRLRLPEPHPPPHFYLSGKKKRGVENEGEGGFSSREPSGRPTTSPSLCPPSSILSFFIVPSPFFPPPISCHFHSGCTTMPAPKRTCPFSLLPLRGVKGAFFYISVFSPSHSAD